MNLVEKKYASPSIKEVTPAGEISNGVLYYQLSSKEETLEK